MNETKKGILHNVRQSVLTTLVLLLICGFLFPVVLSGLSAVSFPHQADGSLLTAEDVYKRQEKERAPARFCCAGAFLFRIIALMQT